MNCEGTWEADMLLRGVSIKEIGKRQSLRALVGRAESALATYRGEGPMWRVFLPHSRRELTPGGSFLPCGSCCPWAAPHAGGACTQAGLKACTRAPCHADEAKREAMAGSKAGYGCWGQLCAALQHLGSPYAFCPNGIAADASVY